MANQRRKVDIEDLADAVDSYADQNHMKRATAARFLIREALRVEAQSGRFDDSKLAGRQGGD